MATETTYDDAVDEMYGMILDAWQNGVGGFQNAAAIVGYVPEIRWKGRPLPTAVPMEKFWCRASVQLIKDAQSSLTNFEGLKRFRAVGLLYYQIFCPRTEADRESKGRQLAETVQAAFRHGSPSGAIQFRDVTIRELTESEESYPIHVVVNFEFDSIQ